MKQLGVSLWGISGAVLVGLLLAFGSAACYGSKSADGNETKEDGFGAFLSQFSDSTAYAVVTMDGQKVLMVSNEVFNNSLDSTKVELAALAAQLYRLDSKGKVVPLGEVRSQSTGDPVAMAKDGLMTAGHKFVNRYNLDKDGALELTECVNIEFGIDDNVSSYYENRRTNTFRRSKDDKDMDMMFGRFSEAKPVVFGYVKAPL